MVGLGLPRFLTAAVRSGIPPFALVAVDSGDTYYHRRSANDDPQAMLRDELPGWLVADGLAPDNAGLPAATMGISMGAFGELNYAAGRAGHNPLRAIAAVSPAVFRSWQDVTIKRAFNGPADWAAHEPLQHLALAGQPLGVWCGTGDRFIGAARQLARVGHATVSSFTAGGHSTSYWHHVLPDVLRFVGARLSVA
jgi:S-formylglutathione hydrolase FrmB